MKYFLFFLVFFIPTFAHSETITIVADEWCPYNCEEGSAKPGFMVEIAEEVFKKTGHDIVYKTMSWDRALEAVHKGQYYAAIGATRREGEDLIFPAKPQGYSRSYFYVRTSNNWNYEGIKSLDKMRVGFLEDYSYGKALDNYIEKYKDDKSRIIMSSGEEPLEEKVTSILRRDIEAFPEDNYVMGYYLSNNNKLGLLRKAGLVTEKPSPRDEEVFIAFSPVRVKSKEFVKILSDGTEELRKNGRLKEILKKYGLEDWEQDVFGR